MRVLPNRQRVQASESGSASRRKPAHTALERTNLALEAAIAAAVAEKQARSNPNRLEKEVAALLGKLNALDRARRELQLMAERLQVEVDRDHDGRLVVGDHRVEVYRTLDIQRRRVTVFEVNGRPVLTRTEQSLVGAPL